VDAKDELATVPSILLPLKSPVVSCRIICDEPLTTPLGNDAVTVSNGLFSYMNCIFKSF